MANVDNFRIKWETGKWSYTPRLDHCHQPVSLLSVGG
jgi:hypothetical protein